MTNQRPMRRMLTAATGLLALPLLSPGCNIQGPAYNLPSRIYAAVIDMTTTLDFSPDKVTIRTGEVVLWRNQTGFTHTVTADPSQIAEPQQISLPEGAEPFGSGPIPPGEVFAHRDHVSTIRGTYNAIWSQWLAESGHEAADAPDFERYGETFDPQTGKGGIEIWIPLKN